MIHHHFATDRRMLATPSPAARQTDLLLVMVPP
jgi:hypothetical protein